MLVLLLLLLVGSVVALTVARRLAGHWLVVLVKDLFVSVLLLSRAVFVGVRFVVRLISGEVRSW
jgi:hypothetical protein